MSLGFNREELDRLFQREFEAMLEVMQTNKAKEIASLSSQGYSKLEAALQVELLNRMAASASTIGSIISANNLRIQSQLESKGIEV